MKLFNLQQLKATVKELVFQFPFPLAYIVVGVYAAMSTVEHSYSFCSVLWLLCVPCMLLSLSITLIAAANAWSVVKKLCGQILPLAVLVAYAIILPHRINSFEAYDVITFGLLMVASALMLTFSPLVGNKEENMLWVYNHKIFTRLFFAGFFSGVLYLGIVVALVAIDALFRVHIRDKVFMHLFALVFGLFGASFFVAGFVNQVWHGVERIDFAKILKVFVMYILLPLVAVYMIILYVYFLRIGMTWELPRGWASSLVLVLAGVGMLSYAAIWPLAKSGENAMASFYNRYFFWFFAPLLTLLYIATVRRIADYGITEMRYFLAIIALWLTFVVGYFLFSKKKDLKLVPITLVVIAIIASFGPLSAFSVSYRSQLGRLEKVLSENKILVNGVLDTTHIIKSDSVSVRINGMLNYLEKSRKGLVPLQKRWGVKFPVDSNTHTITRESVAEALHLSTLNTYNARYDYMESVNFYWRTAEYLRGDEKNPFDVAGYQYFFESCYLNNNSHSNSTKIALQKDVLTLSVSSDEKYIQILRDDNVLIQESIADYVSEKQTQGWSTRIRSYDDEQIATENQNLDFVLNAAGYKFKFVVTSFTGNKSDPENIKLDNMSFHLLVLKK